MRAAFFVALLSALVLAQGFYSVAYPDDPISGIANPAYLGVIRDLFFAASAQGRQSAEGVCVLSAPFAMAGAQAGDGWYSLLRGIGLGSREIGVGYIARTVWTDGDKSSGWRLGFLSRPARWIAWGATYSERFGDPIRVGFALRPATEAITLWSDFRFQKDLDYIGGCFGGEVKPVRGLRLFGGYDDGSRTVWFGARLNFGRIALICGADDDLEEPFATAVVSSRRFASLLPARVKSVKVVLEGSLAESPPFWGGKSFSEFADALAKAAEDPSVKRIIVKQDGCRLSFAQREEIRSILADFRRRGGRVITFANELGNGGLYMNSVADTICMPPAGDVLFTGIGAELTYYKGLADRLGVRFDWVHVGKYKLAYEPFTADSMSPQMRDEITRILSYVDTMVVDAVAEGRGVSVDRVRRWLADAPHTARMAKSAGMIDTVVTWEEFKKLSGWDDAVGLSEYLDVRREVDESWAEPPTIAVIPIEGGIVHGSSSAPSLFMGRLAGDETVCRLLERARKDKSVKGIILRIDSPGGSAFASDVIWNCVRRVAKDKPVWVSMGSDAASGGYYVASAAESIFADAFTLTGSIGVLGGKLSWGGLFEKLGLRTEKIYFSPNANFFSHSDTFSVEQRRRFRQNLEDMYSLFKERVLAGRAGLTPDSLESLAQGKIHVGAAAAENGLVDGIAGIAYVERRMAKSLGIENNYAVRRFSPYSASELLSVLRRFGLAMDEPLLPHASEEFLFIAPYYLRLK